MKKSTRILSLLLALVMLLTSMSVSSFSYAEESDADAAAFQTAISEIHDQLLQRKTTVRVSVQLPYDSSYAGKLSDINEIKRAVFPEDKTGALNPFGYDYLYHSIDTYSNFKTTSNNTDRTFTGLQFNVSYYATAAMEAAVEAFATQFEQVYLADYISDNMSDTDKYHCVKTIYDFIVRNTKYDDDVRNEVYEKGSERYNLAHSAYGAIYGNLLAEGKSTDDFSWETKTTVTGEKVPVATLQGLAVCEGYSKLFYYLCERIGIPCYLVDGTFFNTEYNELEDHEWIYVYLNDYKEEYGARWYQIDATHAATSKLTNREIDIINYNYFLRGLGYESFTDVSQVPYAYGDTNAVIQPIYDFAHVGSPEDYAFAKADFSKASLADTGAILLRSMIIGENDEPIEQYILIIDGEYFLVVADDNDDFSLKPVEGFEFCSTSYSNVEVILPYVLGDEYSYDPPEEEIYEVKDYTLNVYGNSSKPYEIPFSIVPYDMSTGELYDTNIANNPHTAAYTGEPFFYDYSFRDGYGHKLTPDDYYCEIENEKGQAVGYMSEVGKYTLTFTFVNNYRGTYQYPFEITPADMAEYMDSVTIQVPGYNAATETFHLPYNSSATYSYYFRFGQVLTAITEGTDFTMECSGGLKLNDTGTVTLVGKGNKIVAGSRKTYNYVIDNNHNSQPGIMESEHAYITSTTVATCEHEGYTVHTCTRCGKTYTDNHIPKLGHNYKTTVKEASCTEGGYTEHTCTRCGKTYKDNATPALGHDMGDWDQTSQGAEPTCTLAGTTTGEVRRCSRCDYFETRGGDTVAALGHTWGEWVETAPAVAPTYTAEGKTAVETRTCTRCRTTETRGGTVVPKLTIDISYLNGKTAGAPTYTYTGAQIKPTELALAEDELQGNFRITGYSNNINAGKASVEIEGINEYSGKALLYFNINKMSITNGAVKKSYRYANNNLSFTATYNGKALVRNTDYTLSVVNGRPNDFGVMTRSFRINGKGNFYGGIQYNVNIQVVPKVTPTNITKVKAAKKKVTVTWKKIPKNIKGYRIEYSLYRDFRNYKAVVVAKPKKNSVTIKGLASKKVYYFRIRTYNYNGSYRRNFFSNYSAVKYVKVK